MQSAPIRSGHFRLFHGRRVGGWTRRTFCLAGSTAPPAFGPFSSRRSVVPQICGHRPASGVIEAAERGRDPPHLAQLQDAARSTPAAPVVVGSLDGLSHRNKATPAVSGSVAKSTPSRSRRRPVRKIMTTTGTRSTMVIRKADGYCRCTAHWPPAGSWPLGQHPTCWVSICSNSECRPLWRRQGASSAHRPDPDDHDLAGRHRRREVQREPKPGPTTASTTVASSLRPRTAPRAATVGGVLLTDDLPRARRLAARRATARSR